MEDKQMREEFDTGLAKIRNEIKSQLVPHGFLAPSPALTSRTRIMFPPVRSLQLL